MNGLEWLTLILASMIGTVLTAMIGAVLLALLLANVSAQLIRNDERHRDYRDY